jgi:hypothetical protein
MAVLASGRQASLLHKAGVDDGYHQRGEAGQV